MGTRIDLTQFWLENPQYRGKNREFSIQGNVGALAVGAVNVPIVVQIPMGSDFVATAVYAVPWQGVPGTTAFNALPFLMNIEVPPGRKMVQVTGTQPQNIDFSTFARTAPSVAWDWVWPVRVKSGGQIVVTFDNPSGLATTMNVAFHGVRIFL